MVFLIDSGHGGILNQVSQTVPTGAKEFKHSDGSIVYEGEINRIVKRHVLDMLKEKGIKAVDVCPTDVDLSLATRVRFVNSIAEDYGAKNCLLISLHSNAGGGTGFEIFTTRGYDSSDVYATRFFDLFKSYFPLIRLRSDFVDNDPDKEADFTILKRSICPAILPEWMFFDNYIDYKYMINPVNQRDYAKMIVDFIIDVERNPIQL